MEVGGLFFDLDAPRRSRGRLGAREIIKRITYREATGRAAEAAVAPVERRGDVGL